MDEILIAIQNAANTIAAPNWADIAGVCVALAAVFVAFVVACRQNKIMKKQTEIMNAQASIAEYQNKIALFEKRLEIYDILLSCSLSAEALNDIEDDKSVLKRFYIIFKGDIGEDQEFNRDEAKLYFKNCATKLLRASFFFPKEIVSYITNVSGELFVLTYSNPEADGPKKYRRKKQNYFEAVMALDENKVFESIKKEMTMI